MQPIHTIGYEGLSITKLLAVLQDNAIERVIDIRRNPISRKPGFSKTALQSHLTAAGINYTHIVELGTPNQLRHELRTLHDYSSFFEKVEQYVYTQPGAIHAALDLALSQRCALLCFERNHEECHRMIVAAHIARTSRLQVSVEHIRL